MLKFIYIDGPFFGTNDPSCNVCIRSASLTAKGLTSVPLSAKDLSNEHRALENTRFLVRHKSSYLGGFDGAMTEAKYS